MYSALKSKSIMNQPEHHEHIISTTQGNKYIQDQPFFIERDLDPQEMVEKKLFTVFTIQIKFTGLCNREGHRKKMDIRDVRKGRPKSDGRTR